jgi:hypothetical protein
MYIALNDQRLASVPALARRERGTGKKGIHADRAEMRPMPRLRGSHNRLQLPPRNLQSANRADAPQGPTNAGAGRILST